MHGLKISSAENDGKNWPLLVLVFNSAGAGFPSPQTIISGGAILQGRGVLCRRDWIWLNQDHADFVSSHLGDQQSEMVVKVEDLDGNRFRVRRFGQGDLVVSPIMVNGVTHA